MGKDRRMIVYGIYMILGAVLFGLGCAEVIDPFWGGMGSACMFVGIFRGIQMYRFRKNDEYREKVETEMADERNHFIRNKAWAWAGYLFIILAGIAVIVLKIVGEEMLSLAASYAVCLMLSLYWISYFVLRKKY